MSSAERYIRATRSSHLELKTEAGDVDVLIAAGMADRLGTVLLRCRQEWDAGRAQLEQADENLAQGHALADREARSVGVGPTRAALLRRNVEDEALQLRAFILLGMTSLRPAKEALKRHASNRAVRRSMNLQPFEIARCVGHALDVWLDTRCNACEGRGVNGGYGAPQIICQACKGSKVRRRVFPANHADEQALGEWLLAEMDRVVADSLHTIRRARSVIDARKRFVADGTRS